MASSRSVLLYGGEPWGFRVCGGSDVGQPLKIGRASFSDIWKWVISESKATQSGLREGDIITSINDQPTKNLSNFEAHALLKVSGDVLKLGLNEEISDSPKSRKNTRTYRSETFEETFKQSSQISYSSKKTIESRSIINKTDKNNTAEGTDSGAPLDPRQQLASLSDSTCSTPSTLVAEGNNEDFSSDKAIASPRSSYSNCTTPSNLSLNFEEGIWSPGQQNEPVQNIAPQSRTKDKDDPISPVWTPKSANSSPTVERKEFRPLNYQSPTLSRRNRTLSEGVYSPDSTTSSEPPWKKSDYQPEPKLSNSQSTPGFTNFSRLPKAQNPTITLLQKAREGQLPKGAQYIEPERKIYDNRPPIKYPGEIVYQIKNEYTSEPEAEPHRKMADLGPRKFEGVGPVTKDGMPLILRSEVKEKDQSKWYKRMYDTIHKQKPHRDEYVTIKYKQKRAQYPYTSGYLSEPEPGAYDSDFTDYRYTSLDRRREQPVYDFTTSTMPRNGTNRSNSSSDIIKPNNPPGRIENYVPGHSSISDKEAKEWWDEVMDIFDGERRAPPPRGHPKSFINQALRESGYESDSTLVFRKREDPNLQLSPKEQKEAYKTIQKGGDIPLHGLRKPAPEKPKEIEHPPPPPRLSSFEHGKAENSESPRKYLEKDVTIHYKSPVRQEVKGYLSEDELASRQADNLRKMYQEEKRRRYLQVSKSLQELQDTNSRRHTDNFIPSQKSPISLTRYDDFDDLAPTARPKPRSPEPRLVARALYNFIGQTPKELTFRKGDLVYLRRQIDKNWYEGELNAMVGLFPVNYVEIVPYESTKPANALITTTRKPYEGQARAKYNFLAQTHLELSLAKGELVTITRKVDNNWFEGKIGGRKGIFPVSYVEVLIDPKEVPQQNGKPVASPAAHSLLLNGSSQGKESMGSHLYSPHLGTPQIATSYHAKPVQISGSGTYSTLDRSSRNPVDKALHIDTQSDPTPYRALYKYTPQNDDELELFEGDTVYVLEKCDDGWFVGSSDRTGAFGTFPGNYVEKI